MYGPAPDGPSPVSDPRTSPCEHRVTPPELVQSAAVGLAVTSPTTNGGTARTAAQAQLRKRTAHFLSACADGADDRDARPRPVARRSLDGCFPSGTTINPRT